MKKSIYYKIIILIWAITIAPINTIFAKSNQKFVVIIDAGHGGGDAGTPHRKLKKDEKHIALDVALRLGNMISRNYNDVRVVYTRKTDVYPTLPERTKIAKKEQGNLFISIHVNAAPNSAAKGIETYVFGVTGLKGKSADEQKRIRERMANERENLDISGKQVDFDKDMDIITKILCQNQREKNNKYSEEVAHYVQNSIISSLKKTSYKNNVNDRGVKEKNIFVLCYSPMPAILVELGYMSNPAEEVFMNSEEGLSTYANAIYRGFQQYKKSWEKRKLKDGDEKEAVPEPVEEQVQDPEPEPEQAAPKQDVKQQKESKQEAKSQEKQNNKQEAKPQQKQNNKQEAKPQESKPEEVKHQDKAVAQEAAGDKNKPSEAKSAKTEEDANAIIYKVQFLTSPKILQKGDSALKGLWPVSYYKDGGLYKYTYGEGTSQSSISADLKKVKALFNDAFMIKTDKEGNRIK